MAQFPFEAQAREWWPVFKRTFRDYQEAGHTDWAAALTFYALLMVFPVLLAVVSFVGLIGGPAVRPLMDNFDASAPGGAVSDIVFISLSNLLHTRGQAFVLMVVGIGAAIWAAMGFISTFRRACSNLLGTANGRRPERNLSLRYGIPFLIAAMMAFAMVMVLFTGGPATRISQMLAVGPAGAIVWNILKWPALALLVAAMLVLLHRTASTIRNPNYRGVTPGIAVAVILWLVVSLLFAAYLAAFGAYNQTYASLAAVIIFLVWFWALNNAILLGVRFDADLRRAKTAEASNAGDGGHGAAGGPAAADGKKIETAGAPGSKTGAAGSAAGHTGSARVAGSDPGPNTLAAGANGPGAGSNARGTVSAKAQVEDRFRNP